MKNKCLGLGGFLSGHKWTKIVGEYIKESNYCWRCGMPRGGWE